MSLSFLGKILTVVRHVGCHRIRLVDYHPFRLPYHRLSPAHYQKLNEKLDEMEEMAIIKKSSSEYASPLVLVLKKMEIYGFVLTLGGLLHAL